MNATRILALGAITVTGLIGAATASAAPDISSVDVSTAGAKRVEVSVETVRGTSTVEPRVSVRIGRRAARLDSSDWDPATGAAELVLSTGLVRARVAVGDTVNVRVRVCDTDCATQRFSVKVVAGDPAEYPQGASGNGQGQSSGSSHAPAPLPAGAITADQASAIALAAVAGTTLVRTERAHDAGAVWEVKLLGADGSRTEVLIAADGTIVRQKTEAPEGADSNHAAPAPLPAGAVTAEQASANALVAVPGTVREIERTTDAGAVWKVKVAAADGTRHRVYVAADGSITRDVTDR